MARFLYFLPIEPPTNWSQLPEGHVKNVLRGADCIFRAAISGPAGEPGCVALVGGDEETAPGFYPDKQTWRNGYPWGSLGWENDKLPTPADLLRKDAVGGDPVTLGDGHDWLLPLLGPAWMNLPCDLDSPPEGGCQAVLKEEFKPLCKESEWWFDCFHQKGGYSFDRFMSFAADALACNYRVGKPEVGALKLLGTDAERNALIIGTLVGVLRAVEELKKNREAGGRSETAG